MLYELSMARNSPMRSWLVFSSQGETVQEAPESSAASAVVFHRFEPAISSGALAFAAGPLQSVFTVRNSWIGSAGFYSPGEKVLRQ